jgi:hypothetical protein
MKKISKIGTALVALAFALSFATGANAAPGPHGPVATAPGQNKIQCFSGTMDGGYNGTCTLNSNGAKGSATLNNNDNDLDPYNNYSGVYTANSNMYGKTVGNVGQLSFTYTGDVATAGSPRFSIPLSTDGNSTSDVYSFVSAYYCNNGAGLVDVVNDSTCTIYVGSETFENWAALVAAHPTWTIATDAYVFIIADDPGVWTVSNVTFGKPGK